jgi:hypothetical protein
MSQQHCFYNRILTSRIVFVLLVLNHTERQPIIQQHLMSRRQVGIFRIHSATVPLGPTSVAHTIKYHDYLCKQVYKNRRIVTMSP